MQLSLRTCPPSRAVSLWRAGFNPLLGRLWGARGVETPTDVRGTLADLLRPEQLKGAREAAEFLAECIATQQRLLVISDYDCDGATACAVAVRGLRALGAVVDFLVPDRLVHGYGLTPEIVDLAAALAPRPDYIITVDNGISSAKGIAHANALGIPVLVTDHHLPPPELPAAVGIVNPNQPGCSFPSKVLAGVGVMWYVIWALEQHLAAQGKLVQGFAAAQLLPLVAVGTVADVVPLDRNNRLLVKLGLDMIRAQRPTFAGLEALAAVGECDARQLSTTDIAFGLGPRINAAGRLKSMKVGIDCLLTDDLGAALQLAEELHATNQDRKTIEADTVNGAVAKAMAQIDARSYTIAVHDPEWHPGVIGIVAGRVRELAYRPAFVLATAPNGEIKGSGRSIPGFHLKHALDRVALKNPAVLLKYGGHAMAAGLSIAGDQLAVFTQLFEEVAREMMTPADLLQIVETDGSLANNDCSLSMALLLRDEVWGQGFPEPVFCDEFEIRKASLVKGTGGQKTLKLDLLRDGIPYTAVRFRHDGDKPEGRIRLVYKLAAQADRRGGHALRLLVDHLFPA